MKIWVAGQERTEQLAPALQQAAAELAAANPIPPRPALLDALALRQARDPAEFLAGFVCQARAKCHVDPALVVVPAAPGWRGRLSTLVRGALWKLLRHQHAQVMQQQNLVNGYLADALEYEQELLAELRARVARLEARAGSLEPRP